MKRKLLIFLIPALLSIACKSSKLKIENPIYGIGTIVYYKPATADTKSLIDFTYTDNGKMLGVNYHNTDKGWVVPDIGIYNAGDTYMIEYDGENLQNCRMLFGYPVSDSSEYRSYAKLFKDSPPN